MIPVYSGSGSEPNRW